MLLICVLLFICNVFTTLVPFNHTAWIAPINNERAIYGLTSYIEDPDLISLAQNYTETCQVVSLDQNTILNRDTIQQIYAEKKGQTYTGAADQRIGGSVGQGSAISTASPDRWLAQKVNWTCINNTCSSIIPGCQGYTHLIWQSTTRIGCSISNCGNNNYMFTCLFFLRSMGSHPFGVETWRCTSPDPPPGWTPGTAPDGTPITPQGTAPDGTPITPSGTTPDGTPITPSGTAPDGTPITPSGTTPDGTPITPSGTAPDGTPISPSGSNPTNPSGSNSLNGGNQTNEAFPVWAIVVIVLIVLIIIGVIIIVVVKVVVKKNEEQA